MKTNLYSPNIVSTFCGNHKKLKKLTPQTNIDNFSLERLQLETYGNSHYKPIIPDLFQYIKNGKVKKEEIKGVLDHGGLSIIFDLGENVLKASLENPLEFREHNSSIDIPFLSPVEKFGKTFFVKEAKADTKQVSPKDCLRVIRRIYRAGLEPSCDFDRSRTWQIGKYKDKPYLLDTRCARPRPNRFSRFVYDFKRFNQQIVRALSCSAEEIEKREKRTKRRVELYGPQVLHLDESPRQNLSFKRGLAIIRGVMNRNKRFGYSRFSTRAVFVCLIRGVFK